jgi:hypothetical protein
MSGGSIWALGLDLEAIVGALEVAEETGWGFDGGCCCDWGTGAGGEAGPGVALRREAARAGSIIG